MCLNLILTILIACNIFSLIRDDIGLIGDLSAPELCEGLLLLYEIGEKGVMKYNVQFVDIKANLVVPSYLKPLNVMIKNVG